MAGLKEKVLGMLQRYSTLNGNPKEIKTKIK